MVKAKITPAELVALVLENAESLRKVGVLYLELEGCKVQMTPYVPPMSGFVSTSGKDVVVDREAQELLAHGNRPMPTLRRPGRDEE